MQEHQNEAGLPKQLVAARRSNDPTPACIWRALSQDPEPEPERAGFSVRVLESTNPLVEAVTTRLGFRLVRAPAT